MAWLLYAAGVAALAQPAIANIDSAKVLVFAICLSPPFWEKTARQVWLCCCVPLVLRNHSLSNLPPQIPIKTYKYETYQGIVDRLFVLQDRHKPIIRVYTASEELGVPAYGATCVHIDPRTKQQKTECEIYIAEVDTGDTGNITYAIL
jgi:hypothetical protein